MIHNDSVVALACGTGTPSQGCVLIIGTGERDARTPSFHFLCKPVVSTMAPETPTIAREGRKSAVALSARNINICCFPAAVIHMVNSIACLQASLHLALGAAGHM